MSRANPQNINQFRHQKRYITSDIEAIMYFLTSLMDNQQHAYIYNQEMLQIADAINATINTGIEKQQTALYLCLITARALSGTQKALEPLSEQINALAIFFAERCPDIANQVNNALTPRVDVLNLS